MLKKLARLSIVLVIMFIATPLITAGLPVTNVTVSRTGDNLTIKGVYSNHAGEWVSAEIRNPVGDVVYLNSVQTSNAGEFTFGFLFAKGDMKGDYRIKLRGSGSDDTIYETVYNYSPSGDSSFHSFSINGREGMIKGNTITVTLPANTDRSGLRATFSVEKNAVVTVNGVVQISGVTQNNFLSPVTYTVTADDKSVSTYIVTVDLETDTRKKPGGGGGGGGSGSFGSRTVIEMPEVTPKPVLEPPPKPDPATPPESTGDYFDDVPADYWAAGYIELLYDYGVMDGKTDTRFFPEEAITREEFVKLICEALMLDIDEFYYYDDYYDEEYEEEYADEYDPFELTFEDVPADAWFTPYIMAAVKEGLVNGISETTFGVGEKITRQDMAVLIHRCVKYFELEEEGSGEPFADDADIADYARDSVYAMRGMRVIGGLPGNIFAPMENVTRAQAAKIIYVFMYITDSL